MRIVKNVLVNTQVVTLTGLVATLMLSAAPASAQSKIPQREMSYCMATLTGQTPGARVNLRSGPGTNYQQKGYGLVGDRVHILRESGGTPQDLAVVENRQGFSWYRVGFPKSGARGWVRGDFMTPECFN
ncbi:MULTISPECIES: SH3 domain-containing protein [Cyanophyceae]|uniref:SH3 domain-containing protein n=1 Tax=Cyanophyceae TaxID=3028117 RepID=UPI001F556505|nr:SH3 domain-containing protein [Trichocoleus sp. FACHB-69]